MRKERFKFFILFTSNHKNIFQKLIIFLELYSKRNNKN